jgi:hypothetical protein
VQQAFELGEDLLDGVEVGRVFRQEEELGTGRAESSPSASLFSEPSVPQRKRPSCPPTSSSWRISPQRCDLTEIREADFAAILIQQIGGEAGKWAGRIQPCPFLAASTTSAGPSLER